MKRTMYLLTGFMLTTLGGVAHGGEHTDQYGTWSYVYLLDENNKTNGVAITDFFSNSVHYATVETPALIGTYPVLQYKGGRPICETLVIKGNGNLIVFGAPFADWSEGPTNVVLHGVKTIGHFYDAGAFRGNANLETVTADNSLETIEQYAFDGCAKLRGLAGAAQLKEIQTCAFRNCTALETLPLNSGLGSIGNDAFSGCSSVVEVDIPNSVTNIGGNAFINCPSVEYITFGSGYSPIRSLFSSDQMTLLRTLTIHGNGETTVNGGAFSKYPMRHVVLTGVKELPAFYATGPFMGCENLETVEVDDALTTLVQHAFDGCAKLRSVTGLAGIKTIETSAFLNCTSLESISLSEGLETIAGDAFNGCSALLEVDIPDSVTSIGGNAFANCPSLTSISLGSGLATISDGLFSTDMPFLQTLEIRGSGHTVISASAFKGLPMRSVTMTGVETIGGNGHGWGAFQNCTNLVTLAGDEYLKTIEYYAFDGCTSLASVTGLTGLTAIRYDAFRNCSSLEAITLPEGLATIENDAFNGCSALRNVCVPDSVTSIGGSVWLNCTALTNIAFGAGLSPIPSGLFSTDMPFLDTLMIVGNGETVIDTQTFKGFPMRRVAMTGVVTIGGNGHGWGAFQNCTNLVTLAGDEYLKTIEYYAFDGCTSMSSVTGLTGLTAIRYGAFRNCSSLEAITLPKGLATIENDAFNGCSALRNVCVPDSVTSIGGSVWLNCTALTNIAFGAGISPIPSGLFSADMPFLQTLTIHGNGLTGFDCGAFKGFPMRRVEMTGVKAIGGNSVRREGSFQNCTNLVTVTASGALTTIEPYAFHGCTNLKSITGMTGLTTICDYAFSYCSSLECIVLPATLTAMNGGFNACAPEKVVLLCPPPSCSTTFDSSCRGYYVGNTSEWKSVISGGKWCGMTMVPAGYVEQTGGRGLLITEAWLDELDAEFGEGTSTTFRSRFGDDISTAIFELTGKLTIEREAMPVWHDYVTGTNPVDLDSRFRTFITMSGTTPEITYEPVRGDRTYRLYGATELGAEMEWTELKDGEEANYNFFNATVEVK